MTLTFKIYQWHKSKFFFVPLQVVVRVDYSAFLALTAATAAALSTSLAAASPATACLLSTLIALATVTARLLAATLFVALVSFCHFLSLLD